MSLTNAFIRWPRTLGLAMYGLAAFVGAAVAAPPPGDTATSTTVIHNDGEGTNHIVVTGNSARNVTIDCSQAGQERPRAEVNSVNIDGRSLKGETIIVAGRNTRDVQIDTRCDQKTGNRGSVNVNSVNIR